MGKKRKINRDKYGPDTLFEDKMDRRISAVVTGDQLDAAKKVARESGKTVSTWARDVLLAALKDEKALTKDGEAKG